MLHFKQPAGTSRGVYLERKVWYIHLVDEEQGRSGVGECAPLPKLSCDDIPDYERVLRSFLESFAGRHDVSDGGILSLPAGLRDAMRRFPSMLFGLETAIWHFNSEGTRLSATAFANGERGIQINGLIWMGTFEEMKSRIEEKLRLGFRCVKLKIGAINFDEELELLRAIRSRFGKDAVELRVDANGAFSPGADARRKLGALSTLDLHSIEQPIRAGQWAEMAALCRETPLPVALDEELIGVNDTALKVRLLDEISPQYIILKPSLHGGLAGCEEWVRLAEERGIGWWATSALESNVGLNAIAHWCATMQEKRPRAALMPQGLGTGQLFLDNVPYPLEIRHDEMWYTA